MAKYYNNRTYEESVKQTRKQVASSSYFISGYCEIPNGTLNFQGYIPGISRAQARYYVIYMIRDIYGSKVWINPIFYVANKPCRQPMISERVMYFNLEKYIDNRNRMFITFNEQEANQHRNTKNSVGDLMPRVISTPNFPIITPTLIPELEPNFEPPFAEPIFATTTSDCTLDDDYDYDDYYVSLSELEDMCNLPEGVGLFDDDR